MTLMLYICSVIKTNIMSIIEKTIEKYNLECQGNCYKNDDNFNKKDDTPCYIPENYDEDEQSIYSYNKIKEEVTQWLKLDDTKDYLLYAYDDEMPIIDEDFINGWVVNVYETIDWQFPSTLLCDYSQ